MAGPAGHAALGSQSGKVHHDSRAVRIQESILGVLVPSRSSLFVADSRFLSGCHWHFHYCPCPLASISDEVSEESGLDPFVGGLSIPVI